MVDLAGVVGVVGDHRRDDPARRPQLAPVRRAGHRELIVVGESGDVRGQALVHGRRARRSRRGAERCRRATAGPSGRPSAGARGRRRTRRTSACTTPTWRTIDSIDRAAPGGRARQLTSSTVARFVSSAWLSFDASSPRPRNACRTVTRQTGRPGVPASVRPGSGTRRSGCRPGSCRPRRRRSARSRPGPVSVVAGLRAPVWVSPAKPGSVSVTTRSTVTGSSTPIVSPW